jgi:hypothetical protein
MPWSPLGFVFLFFLFQIEHLIISWLSPCIMIIFLAPSLGLYQPHIIHTLSIDVSTNVSSIRENQTRAFTWGLLRLTVVTTVTARVPSEIFCSMLFCTLMSSLMVDFVVMTWRIAFFFPHSDSRALERPSGYATQNRQSSVPTTTGWRIIGSALAVSIWAPTRRRGLPPSW